VDGRIAGGFGVFQNDFRWNWVGIRRDNLENINLNSKEVIK
jgi:nicotinamide mononucleotide (NMN) deamidase PncC